MTTVDDQPGMVLVVDNIRLVVPEAGRKRVLRLLHVPHAGLGKTRVMAKERYYWPGMYTDVGRVFGECDTCIRRHPSKPQHESYDKKWEAAKLELMMQVSADHFSIIDKKYLVMVDRYSSFPNVWKVEDMTTPSTIQKLKVVFSSYSAGRPK